jgi:hypothetical protein
VIFLVCEVFVAVDEFKAGEDVGALEGVTEGERSWYDGAIVVFAQEGGRAWFGSGGRDESVGEGRARRREASERGWWCLSGYGWVYGK